MAMQVAGAFLLLQLLLTLWSARQNRVKGIIQALLFIIALIWLQFILFRGM